MKLKNQIQSVLKSLFSKIGIYDFFVCVFFGLACFSIPTFSFLGNLNLITWAFTITFLGLMAYKVVFINKQISFDYISFSLIFFVVSSLFSSFINGMVNFSLTANLMTITTFAIYTFLKENKHLKTVLIKTVYYATILFLVAFIAIYIPQLAVFNIDGRLGQYFGNINDVAIFIGLGTCLSIFYAFSTKKWYFRLINGLLCALFIYCGLSTGAKILLLTSVIIFIFFVVLFYGKKKWYISLILIASAVVLGIAILYLPFSTTIRERFFSMIVTFFDIETSTATYVDYSSIHRLHMFLNGLEMMLRKPLFGYGFHGFHNYSSFGYEWSHNNFSETMVCFGVTGTVLYFFPFVYSILKSPSKFKEDKNNLLFIVILVFYFICMFSFAFDVQKLFSYTIGIVYASLSEQKNIYVFKPHAFFKCGKKEAKI
jgi:O-antigen ligase